MQALEDPFYYLANFQHVLDWIEARYGDLLSASELSFIEIFPTLPRPSRALLVRMVMRKGTLFRARKLTYSEIGPAAEAVKPLVEQGWVDARPDISLEQLFGLLTKPEITANFRPFLERPGARKDELLQALLPAFPEPRDFARWCALEDAVYSLDIMAMCDRFRLMFFGNLHQDWSEFVLADLGLYRFETVEFSAASRAFQKRSEVDQYLHLYQCRERFELYAARQVEEPEEFAEIIAAMPVSAGGNAWLEARRAKLLYQVAYHCERHGELTQALALYADCSHPDARIRRIRVLERCDQLQPALELARAADQAPQDEAEKQHLLRIMPRLQRKLGLAKDPRPEAAPVVRIDLQLPVPEGPCSVENAVRAHLSEAEGPVWYVENTLINSLFGLLCWEAIFAPVPGAFFHRFHSGPADLLRSDFGARRQPLFDGCLARLDSGEYKDSIRRTYQAKQGLQSPFVFWEGLGETLLEQALACFPPAHLKAWFRRLLADIKANRAGLPDLIQFWPQEARYRMIEVKGPGDRLQDNQVRWLEFCARHGMPVEVCYVQWAAGGRTTGGRETSPGEGPAEVRSEQPEESSL